MKYIGFVICAVTLFLGFNGFDGNRAQMASINQVGKKKITFAQTLAAELAELARPAVRTTVDGRQEAAQMGKDNSVIQTIYDAFGNKTESRVFYNDSLLKMIILKTSANGQKEALVYGQNGEVKIAPPNALDKVLTAVGSEIARTVEIFEGRKGNEMLAKLNASAEDVSVLNLDQPFMNEVALVAETAPAVAPVETQNETVEPSQVETNKTEEIKTEVKPVQTEDSTLKLRAMVQSLKAVRKNVSSNELTAKAN